MEFTSVKDHYDLMAREMDDAGHLVTDPFYDTGPPREWLEHADGARFFEAVGEIAGRDVLEIGIGTGRVAAKFLRQGCASLVGLDISPLSLERAARNLAPFPQVELVLADAQTFARPDSFDIAYAVWTLFHLPDARSALANAVHSLRTGGRVVLSVESVDEVLDYGSRLVKQHPLCPQAVAQWMRELGCEVFMVEPCAGADGTVVTTLIAARKQ